VDKIKSIKCFDKEKFGKCSNLAVGAIVRNKCVAHYCIVKEKEIVNPKGKMKCKEHEIGITEGMLGKIDMRKDNQNGIYFRTNYARGYSRMGYVIDCCHCCS